LFFLGILLLGALGGNAPMFFALVVVGLLVGAFFFLKSFSWFRQKRLIEDIPTSKIRSIAMGLVEVFGEVVPAEKVLKSPISNKDCVYYSYTVEEYLPFTKKDWKTIRTNERRIAFFLKDDTGTVLVDPHGSRIEVPPQVVFQTGIFTKNIPEKIKAYLESKGIKLKDSYGITRTFRFEESAILVKDNLYVMGKAEDNPLVEEASSKKSSADIIIRKARISDKSEREILRALRLKYMLGMFFGFLLIISSVCCILMQESLSALSRESGNYRYVIGYGFYFLFGIYILLNMFPVRLGIHKRKMRL